MRSKYFVSNKEKAKEDREEKAKEKENQDPGRSPELCTASSVDWKEKSQKIRKFHSPKGYLEWMWVFFEEKTSGNPEQIWSQRNVVAGSC